MLCCFGFAMNPPNLSLYDSCMLLGFLHWFGISRASFNQIKTNRKPTGQSMIDSQGQKTNP